MRSRFLDIGWLEYELLCHWQGGGDGAALLNQVAPETPLPVRIQTQTGQAAYRQVVPGSWGSE